jgi:hypothetical protein
MPSLSALSRVFKRSQAPELRLDDLPEEVLREVVKEAQAMLTSQFQSYLGLMTRGFTMAGLVLTGTTAFLAASVSSRGRVATEMIPNFETAHLLFAGLLLLGSLLALISALPGRYSLPGNEPWCWNMENWKLHGRQKPSMKLALLSQAEILQSQITKNRRTNRKKAWLQISSFSVTFVAVLIGLLNYLGT